MTFAGTYRDEVIASRRDRSRRAFFWAKVTSIVLMLTIAVTLRAEPDLRRLLMSAGMDAIAGFARIKAGNRAAALPVDVSTPDAQQTLLPRSRIKVNRPAEPLVLTPSRPTSAEVDKVLNQIRQDRP